MSIELMHLSRALQRSPMTVADRYRLRVTSATEDPPWDAFLARARGGHHMQTSLWARLKAPLGWEAERVVVAQDMTIVAGAQLLIRRLPLGGSVAYIPRGPVVGTDDPALLAMVQDAVRAVVRKRRIRYLAVQPPRHGEWLARELAGYGFRPSALQVAPAATVLLDLSRSTEALLSSMKPKTRYNIRLATRRGVVVREGAETDLGTFYRLLMITGRRQRFSSYPESYFSYMWRVLNPGGHIKLFIAECAGEPVAALLAIAFGDTVSYKRGGWSGQHGDCHPNELMHWAAISWARAAGYRYYDFDGVELPVARALLRGEAGARRSVTAFKLGFSDQVTVFPGTYDRVYNPLLRWAYRTAYPRIDRWPVVAKLKDALRGSY